MKSKPRIASLLNADSLGSSISGLPAFELSTLDLAADLDFPLPTNVRLGHLAETIVSELIKASKNIKVLHENIQVVEDKKTIGEIDFILEDVVTTELIHMELAYKFYLFDPSISSEPINNWIGPNRNDSLKEKLEKLKRNQFPLLYHPCTQSQLPGIDLGKASQALCLLVSLFVPYDFEASLHPAFQKVVKGHYLSFEAFSSLDHSAKSYHIPAKKEWGMPPAENETWTDFKGVEKAILKSIRERQAPLCWQRHGDTHSVFFIVWW